MNGYDYSNKTSFTKTGGAPDLVCGPWFIDPWSGKKQGTPAYQQEEHSNSKLKSRKGHE